MSKRRILGGTLCALLLTATAGARAGQPYSVADFEHARRVFGLKGGKNLRKTAG